MATSTNDPLNSTLTTHYPRLKRLAQYHLKRLPPGQTMSATALVHEAFVKVAKKRQLNDPTESEMLALLSYAIRDVLISSVRSKMRAKRRNHKYASSQLFVRGSVIDEQLVGADLVRLDDALRELEEIDSELSKLVTLHIFGELSLEQIAGVAGVSLSTVKRRWRSAKAWLSRSLSDEVA